MPSSYGGIIQTITESGVITARARTGWSFIPWLVETSSICPERIAPERIPSKVPVVREVEVDHPVGFFVGYATLADDVLDEALSLH